MMPPTARCGRRPSRRSAEQLAAKLALPEGITTDAESIYNDEHGRGTILADPKAGGAPVSSRTDIRAAWIALDATRCTGLNQRTRTVKRRAKTGARVRDARALEGPQGLAVDDGFVYVATP